MARALSHEARLIIMDEPSAVLAHDEVGNLFRIIRELTAQGIAVIYISHRLEEIREIGDRVTVLKDGRTTAANLPARDHADPRAGQPDDRPHHRVRLPAAPGEPRRRRRSCCEVDGLTRAGEFADVVADRPQRRDRRHRRAGRLGPLGAAGDHLRRPPGRQPARSRWTASALRPGSVGAAVRAGLGHGPRGAQEPGAAARRADLPQHDAGHLRRLRHGRASPTPAGSGPRRTGSPTQLELRPRDVRRAGAHAVRRQPAEGRGRPLAARRHPAAAARRADPRRRRRRPGRALPGDPRPGRRAASACCWSPARCPRCSAWPTGCW